MEWKARGARAPHSLERAEESLDELGELAASAGAQIVGRVFQSRVAVEAATLVGQGKVEEIAAAVRTAHVDTAVLLADALGLPEQARVLFVAAARGKAPAAEVLTAQREREPGVFAAAAARALPRDIAAFTGRRGCPAPRPNRSGTNSIRAGSPPPSLRLCGCTAVSCRDR